MANFNAEPKNSLKKHKEIGQKTDSEGENPAKRGIGDPRPTSRVLEKKQNHYICI